MKIRWPILFLLIANVLFLIANVLFLIAGMFVDPGSALLVLVPTLWPAPGPSVSIRSISA